MKSSNTFNKTKQQNILTVYRISSLIWIHSICLAGYLTSFGSIFPSHESAKKKCEKRVKCPAVLSVKSFNRIYIAAEPQRGSTFFACIEIWDFSQMFVGRLPWCLAPYFCRRIGFPSRFLSIVDLSTFLAIDVCPQHSVVLNSDSDFLGLVLSGYRAGNNRRNVTAFISNVILNKFIMSSISGSIHHGDKPTPTQRSTIRLFFQISSCY